MPTYTGPNYELRIATNAQSPETSTVLTYNDSFTYNVRHGVKLVPKGMGSYKTEPSQGLTNITGVIKRRADATKVIGGSGPGQLFAVGVGAYHVNSPLTALYMQVKNKNTNVVEKFGNVMGEYTKDRTIEGEVVETYTWSCEDLEVSSTEAPA